jgi:hypothetical protein
MQARDVGQKRIVSVRSMCLDRHCALSRHFTLHLTRPAPSVAKRTGIGEWAAAVVVHAAVDRFGSSY